jgi:hypothetical protein
MQFSADKIELVKNDSIINVNAQDDYTFTRSFPQTEDLRYEVEKSSIDNEEKEKTLSLLERIDYILSSKAYSDADSKFNKLKRWIIYNKWLIVVGKPEFYFI